MKRLFDRLGTIWVWLFQRNAWERPRKSLRPYCSYLATTQASRLEPNCKWTAEALILTCLKGINMNGEKDKLIRDFMNACQLGRPHYHLGNDRHTASILIYMESVGDACSFLSALAKRRHR